MPILTLSNLSSSKRQYYLTTFAVILCGSLCLPMLPIWVAGLHVLAALVFISNVNVSTRYFLAQPLLMMLLAVAAFWLNSLLQNPSSHVVEALTNIYGHSIGILPGSLLLIVDFVCLIGLSLIAIKASPHKKLISFFLIACVAFWSCSLMAPAKLFLLGGESENLTQMLAGSSVWASWCFMALLPMVLVREENDIHVLLKGALLGVFLVATVIVMQWLFGDYSYVLDAPNFENYFYRVRGTYYYHAPAIFAVAMGCMFLLATLRDGGKHEAWKYLGVLFLGLVVWLNNTRGVSLALMCGAIIVFIGAVRFKKLPLLVLALVIASLMASSIFYVKPISGETLSAGVVEELVDESKDAQNIEENVLAEVAIANKGRSLLFFEGVAYLPTALWAGSGIGVLDLPLKGDAFNGLQSTYSAHTIYLDIALMAGLPALLFFLITLTLGGGVSVSHLITDKKNSNSYRLVSCLGALAIFFVASLFLPQERNNLVGFSFFLASLLMLYPASGIAQGNAFTKKVKLLFASIIFGVMGWAVLTSPSYVFPIVEFVARHGKELAAPGMRVGVTNPVLKPMVYGFLKLRGVENPDVFVLEDDPDKLPVDKTWILWDPASDTKYPELRLHLGYQKFRQGGQAPSLLLPNHWWVMPSSQPVLMYLYVGSRSVVTLPISEVSSLVCSSDVKGFNISSEISRSYSLSGQTLETALSIEPKRQVTNGVCFNDISEFEGDLVGEQLGNALSSSRSSINFESIGEESVVVATLPNQAVNVKKSLVIESIYQPATLITDLNYGSGITWSLGESVRVLFDMGSDVEAKIGVYSIAPFKGASDENAKYYSWDFLGSDDGESWILLDQVQNTYLGKSAKDKKNHLVVSGKPYRYYSFHFSQPDEMDGHMSGISEIELYTFPN